MIATMLVTLVNASVLPELFYDDGAPEIQWNIGPVYKVGVMFTDLPYAHNWLVTVRIYIVRAEAGQQLKMYFLDSSFNEIRSPIFTPALQVGWNDIDVSSYCLILEHDFLIAFQWIRPDGGRTQVWLGFDYNNTANHVHSYEYNEWKWPYPYWGSPSLPGGPGTQTGNWMIRAVVKEVPQGVIPEVPLGTIVSSAAMIVALVAYVAMPKLRRNRGYVNL